MVNGIRASDPRGLNPGRSLKFLIGSGVRQETPEEGWRTHHPKRCEYNNKILALYYDLAKFSLI